MVRSSFQYPSEMLEEYNKTVRELFATERQKSLEMINSYWGHEEKLSLQAKVSITPTPPVVQIGLAKGLCDLRCPQCWIPTFVKEDGVRAQFMSWPLYTKIIDQVAEMDLGYGTQTAIRYLGSGESLLDPEIIEKISYAKERLSGPVGLITNGQRLNSYRRGRQKTLAQELLDTRIDLIDISIDATSDEVYQKVRGDRTHTYEQLSKNILKLISLRNDGKYNTLIIGSFLLQPENYRQGHTFITTWGSILDQYILRKYHSYRGHVAAKPLDIPSSSEPCAAPFGRLNIPADGKVTACYIDWLGEEIIGDLNQDGSHVLTLWQHGMRAFQEAHLSGEKPSFCKGCDGYLAAHHGALSYEVIMTNSSRGYVQPKYSDWNEESAYAMIFEASKQA